MIGWSPESGPDLEEATARLRTGEVSVEGRLPWSSNLTFLAEVAPEPGESGGEPLFAVYKPGRGERSLWDFPDGLYRREVAAFALSELLGWGLVPPTVLRDDAPFGPGCLQLFVEADYEQHYFTLLDAGGHEQTLRTICLFDAVANNADRKSGHVLAGPGGRLWAIDHGLCFHPHPKLRTVIWDFAGEPVPAARLGDLERLCDPDRRVFEGLLSDAELRALGARARALLRTGRFPEPVAGDRPPYPWPLV
ncbi:MAG TPA: SCO1664 family protein [Acidimicrobiales bacterium]|nr:SCO1664 family protein [Acidimicrobiales bacterium]